MRSIVSKLGKNQGGDQVGRPEEEDEMGVNGGGARTRHRSMSCPSLPCRNAQVKAELIGAEEPTQPLDEVLVLTHCT